MARIDDPERVELGIDILSFIQYIAKDNYICYFHNLKYDGAFIIDWLLNHDYWHTTDQYNLPRNAFRTLISDMGMFYSITVKWANGNTVEFRDSLKKLPMGVKRIAESFGFDEGKGDVDYHKPRPVGYIMDAEEQDYIRRDVSIVAKALAEIHGNGMSRLTVASDSLAEYKRLNGPRFERLFPVLNTEMDSEIRRAYRGGFTYADERFKGRRLSSGIVLDVNSLYPYIMRERLIPFGEPQYVPGKVETTESRPLSIFSITFIARLKPGHIPCIQIKGNSRFGAAEYIKVIDEPVSIMVTNVDWALYNDHYDITVIEYGGGWLFHGGAGLFDNYIDKWAETKANSTGGKKEIAKLHLNSLYGKFASNPNVTSKIPTLKDDVVKYIRGEDETRPPVYTAAGVFITSWARDLTIRAAQRNYGVFAYADTDSLHLLTDDIPDELEVHKSKLGAWKFEYGFSEAFYIRSKAYIERKHSGEFVVTIAGLPDKVRDTMTFDDLIDGNIMRGKLVHKVVRGGAVLVEAPWELKLD